MDKMTLCSAKLVIKVDENSRPEKVIVMAGQHMLASVSISEVRRVLEQIDEKLPSTIRSREHDGAKEEAADE